MESLMILRLILRSGFSTTSDCVTYTIWSQPQSDLEMVGVGASGQVYNIDDQIVLKTSHIYKRPGSDASDSDQWHYAFHANLLQDERTVLRLLQQHPHPDIMEAIDTNQPEGFYLRKYQPLSEDKISPQLRRIRWYRDLTDALRHLHSFGIAHADIRIENVLVDEQGFAILADFSAASPFGLSNLVFPDLPLPINGPSPTLSDSRDMFAVGSLIFQMEHGAKPELSVDSRGTRVLPEVRSGHQGIDTIIRKAWLGHYSRTSDMLEHLNFIDTNICGDAQVIEIPSFSIESLRDRIREWREYRGKKFGKHCRLQKYLPRSLDNQ